MRLESQKPNVPEHNKRHKGLAILRQSPCVFSQKFCIDSIATSFTIPTYVSKRRPGQLRIKKNMPSHAKPSIYHVYSPDQRVGWQLALKMT
jgi:hypothetical protein